MTMNVENILTVAARIETVPPEQFGMSGWECGAYACIGGWTERIFGRSRGARDILGLDDEIADQLFFPSDIRCPELEDEYLSDYVWASLQPSEVGKVLRNLAATGKVDWTCIDPRKEQA